MFSCYRFEQMPVPRVVLIDSMNPGQVAQPHIQSQARLDPESHPFSLEATLARFGIARLLVKLPGMYPAMPPGYEAYYPLKILSQSLQTSADEIRGLPASLAQASAVTTFGDRPLIVLTARLNNIPGWPEWQSELLQLSSTSQQLFAEKSGHAVQFDEPEAAVAAILQMLQQVRETAAR